MAAAGRKAKREKTADDTEITNQFFFHDSILSRNRFNFLAALLQCYLAHPPSKCTSPEAIAADQRCGSVILRSRPKSVPRRNLIHRLCRCHAGSSRQQPSCTVFGSGSQSDSPNPILITSVTRHSTRTRAHGGSRSFSTVREFFAAKLRKPAQRRADAAPPGLLAKTTGATSRKTAQKLVRLELLVRCP